MGSRSKKRGDGVISFLFYALFGLLMAGFFILAVFLKVKGAVDDSTYHKRFYARDMALIVDSMHASNGDIVMKYELITPQKMSLDVNLDYDKVILTDRSGKPVSERAQTSFLFGHSAGLRAIPSAVNRPIPEFDIIVSEKNISFYLPDRDIKLPEIPDSGGTPK